jgi:hypothetical protein
MAKALVVVASASPSDFMAEVNAGRVTPTEAAKLANYPLELWNNPPQPLTESEKQELVFGRVPQPRWQRRLERQWEDGTEPAAMFARVADGYRQQIHQWLREGWITSETAARLNAKLDSDDEDRLLRVPQELKAARAGRRFQVGVRYDKYGCPHPAEELPT